jgi:hypothetical protein
MKKIFKGIGITILVIIFLLLAGYIYFNLTYPKVEPAQNIKIERTAERIQHGKYLANHVTICIDYHSPRDWTKYSGPVIAGAEGMGGADFGKAEGLPATLYAKNITPYKLNNWTDGELIRLITSGVNKDGNVIFPLMDYPALSHLSEEDLYSIVAYIRSLKPIQNTVPESKVNFPVNLIIKTIPKTYKPTAEPDKSDPKEYGKYLVTIAGCSGCHTPSESGEPIPGKNFSGGMEFNTPWGIVRSANITPDNKTGIGNWTKETFISRFKSFDSDSGRTIIVKPDEFNTVMPWTLFGGMTKEDLSAIYDYLRTLKPVDHLVFRFTPANRNTSSD